jgi:hypothetical protein
MNLQQVHLRINDAATSKPTPVRLRITDAEGRYYAPYGRLTEFATGVNQDVGGNVQLGAKKWAYIDGTCEILLPAGKLHVEITKGPEYKPIDEDVTLLAGKMAMRFTMERWCDMRKEGWYSGDTRVHFLSPDAALLEGQAEDIAVVNLLAKEHAGAIPNILAFSGQTFVRRSPTCGVAVNTQNWHSELGSLGLLHCHRIVFPLTFNNTDWALDDWCGQCHRKKGLVVWTNHVRFQLGEPLANLILGNIDAFELTSFEDSESEAIEDYYAILDAGIQCPLVGASGKECNGQALGTMRTYAFVSPEEPFEYSRWIEAVRGGRMFVTNGPLLQFTIDGHVPGRIANSTSDRPLAIRAECHCLTPFPGLELIWNGEVVASVSPNATSAVLEHEFVPTDAGWMAVRCRGKSIVPSKPRNQRLFAQSSPVFVHYHGQPARGNPYEIRRLFVDLNSMLDWYKASKWPRVNAVLETARTVLAKKLS